MIIIALGTNDLQVKYQQSAHNIIQDLLWYTEEIEKSHQDLEDRKKYFKNEKMPKIIYILPINFDYLNQAKDIFNHESEKKKQEIIHYFSSKNIESLVLNDMPLFEDGIHLNYEGHQKQAELVEGIVVKYDE